MSDVTIRSTGAVSIRAIAEDGEGMASPIHLRDLATERGIDRSFALRELITSQRFDGDLGGSKVNWRNWLKDYESSARRVRPTDADEIRQVLARAADGGGKIRAVGAGHSHSQAARPKDGGIFVELSWYDADSGHLEGVVGDRPPRPRRNDPSATSNYGPGSDPATDVEDLAAVRVGAGEMLKRLNRKILAEKDLGVLNMGSYDAQTVAGAVNTSTHGTGIGLGTFADVVLSVEMATVMESPVDENEPIVRQFRIEPEDGITDSTAFMENVGTHGMALIQDDEVFHASVVGYGAMGVATSYTLLVRDRYFLEEHSKRWKSNNIGSAAGGWMEIKNKDIVKQRLNDDGLRHFNILLNVPGTFGTPSTDGPSCLLRKRRHRPWDENMTFEKWGAPERRSFGDFARNFRRWTSGSGVDPTDPNPGLASTIRNNYFKPLQNKEPFVAFEDRWGQQPKRHLSNTTASYNALRRIPDGSFHNPERPPAPPKDPAMTTEVAVPVEHVEEAIDALIDEVRTVNENDGFYYMAPLGVRFTGPSEHMLAPEYKPPESGGSAETSGSDWPDGFAMLELPFTVGRVDPNQDTGLVNMVTFGLYGVVKTAAQVAGFMPDRVIPQSKMVELSKEALRPIERRLREDFDGRPHMGKYHSLERSDLEEMYEKFDTWYDVYTQFNAFGTFNNGFTDDLGISVQR